AARTQQRPDQVQASIGKRLLRLNPAEYLRQSWINLIALWTIVGPVDMHEYNRFMDDHYPLPLVVSLDGVKNRPLPGPAQVAGNAIRTLFVWVLCVLSALFMLLPLLRLDVRSGRGTWYLPAGTCAAVLMAISLFQIAFSNVAIARYFLNS